MTDTDAVERLFVAALEVCKWLTREELEHEIMEFGSGPLSRCHDWRNHVPDAIADEREELPLVAKLVAFLPAAAAAGG